jgi:hypothetical protein
MPDPATAGVSTVFWVGSMRGVSAEAAGAVLSTVVRVSSEEVCSSPVSSSREAFSWAAGPAQELRIATINVAKRILLKYAPKDQVLPEERITRDTKNNRGSVYRKPVGAAL